MWQPGYFTRLPMRTPSYCPGVYPEIIDLYIVHMKRVTASEARKQWFRLLDEIVAGEVVIVERKGRQVEMCCKENTAATGEEKYPDYRSVLHAPDADRADEWGWEWQGHPGSMTPLRHKNA